MRGMRMAEGRAGASNAERVLHARLLADDPIAPADLANEYLDSVARWLERRYPRGDPHHCTQATGEAIMDLSHRPRQYDPDRASLAGFLRMAADRDYKNLLRAEQRHAGRRADLEAVAHSPLAGKYLTDGEADPIRILVKREEGEEMMARMPRVPAEVYRGLSEGEVRALELLRRRERKTILYAQALGIVDLPPPARRREVKRYKDKLGKRLARAGYGDERAT